MAGSNACGTCMFSRTAPADAGNVRAGLLYCCRYAPSAHSDNPNAWLWPLVNTDWWCSEGAAKGSSTSFSSSVNGLPATVIVTAPIGPAGNDGAPGATGPQGPAGVGYDSSCSTIRARLTTTNANPTVAVSVPVPANSNVWIDGAIQFWDTATRQTGGYVWPTLGYGRGSGNLAAYGSVDINESHNLAGCTATFVVNTVTQSIDVTVTGKAATSVGWSIRLLVDRA